MRYLVGLAAALALVLTVTARAQRPAAPRPASAAPVTKDAMVPFAVGETLTYDVSWSGLLTAGTAVTRVVQKRESFGATAYDITADGRPVPLLARIYPVYYKMDTLLDSTSLLSQWTGLYSEERGRKLKSRAARIPGCVLQAAQCPLPELVSLTQQVQALRERLTA